MSDVIETKSLTAVHISPEDGTKTPLGELEFGAGGQLTLVRAEPKYEQFLKDFIKAVNAKSKLVVKAAPEPGEGQYDLSAKLYERSSPDFYRGLRNYARCYYAMELTSPEDEQAVVQGFEDLS
jgi:hypothetical protein